MSPIDAVRGFEWVVLAYLVTLNASYTLLLGLGWSEISRWVRRRRLRDFETIASSELSLPVSIIVPAFDEEKVIVASVRSLLGAHYPRFEVVIVNDGSSDATLEELRRAFGLVRVERVPRARLQTRPVRGVWVGADDPRVVVVDKENGGKADALNAGLSFARYRSSAPSTRTRCSIPTRCRDSCGTSRPVRRRSRAGGSCASSTAHPSTGRG